RLPDTAAAALRQADRRALAPRLREEGGAGPGLSAAAELRAVLTWAGIDFNAGGCRGHRQRSPRQHRPVPRWRRRDRLALAVARAAHRRQRKTRVRRWDTRQLLAS